MTQQQKQSSQGQSQSRGDDSQAAKSASLSSPGKPDGTSPYQGTESEKAARHEPEQVADPAGPEAMEQPYFSEAQSTLGAFEPTERASDPFAQPEDAQGSLSRADLTSKPTEQGATPGQPGTSGAEFPTPSGTVREGMVVVDSYGHAVGTVAGVEGDRLRLSSTDPHDDGAAFLSVSLIDGIKDDQVLLAGRGDASFGMPVD